MLLQVFYLAAFEKNIRVNSYMQATTIILMEFLQGIELVIKNENQ